VAPPTRGYVFDAGGLGALEGRDDTAKRAARVLAHALEHELPVVVPASVVARVFYEGAKQARLAALLKLSYVELAPLHVTAAKEIGRTRKKTGHQDVVDGHVAWLARTRGLLVVTSDPRDMEKLGIRQDRVVRI
jgi:predicted nucleic acid-binding protein